VELITSHWLVSAASTFGYLLGASQLVIRHYRTSSCNVAVLTCETRETRLKLAYSLHLELALLCIFQGQTEESETGL
jgi:hypothetical protein